MYVILYLLSPTAAWRAYERTFTVKKDATERATDEGRRGGWARAVVKYVDVQS